MSENAEPDYEHEAQEIIAQFERVAGEGMDLDATLGYLIQWLQARDARRPTPPDLREAVPMVLYCPAGHQHIDEGEWATKPHKTHECQKVIPCNCSALYHGECVKTICGQQWRPADFPTVGVAALQPQEQNPHE